MSTAYQIFQAPKHTQIDSSVRITAGAKAFFYASTTVTPQDTYTDAALTTPSTNPVIADANGVFATIYLNPALPYKLTLKTSADVLIYTVDPCNDQILTQALIGQYLYPRTAAEIAAGITPTNYAYPERNVLRYNCLADGTTDNTSAIITVANAMGGHFYIPYNVKFNRATLLSGLTVGSSFEDDSIINDYQGSFIARRKGTISRSNSTNDFNFNIDDDHHPSINTNNFGTAGTTSATNRLASWFWMSGAHAIGTQALGDRLAAKWQFGKESATEWSLHLGLLAPWASINGNYEWWDAGQVISGAGVYRANGNNHYVSANSGTTAAAGPSHTTGTVADGGGVQWTWIDSYDRTVFTLTQNGRILVNNGSFSAANFNYNGLVQDPIWQGQVNARFGAAGVSNTVRLILEPTDGAGASVASPFILSQNGVGWRLKNSANNADIVTFADTGMYMTDRAFSLAQSASAPATGVGGTIATANLGESRTNPAGNITGVILEAGTRAGQTCFVSNEANFTITFAAAATSNVADGVTAAIPALTGRFFVWNSSNSRWHRAA